MSLSLGFPDRYLGLCFKGDDPRSIELARAPLLEKWHVNLVCERIETPSFILLKNAMSLYWSCHRPSGARRRRAGYNDKIGVLDHNGKWARTKHRLYRLGDRSNATGGQRDMDELGILHLSTEDDDATAQLKRDFESSYLKGAEPSSLELASAPPLESWRAIPVRFKRERDPLRLALVLAGSVTGHPQLGNTRMIRTSQLIWLDHSRKWARTRNRIYRLGERANGESVTEWERD